MIGLHIHVTTAAIGEAILSISFAAGLIYLVKVIDQTKASKRTFWLEIVMFALVTALGFVSYHLYFQEWVIMKNLIGLIKR